MRLTKNQLKTIIKEEIDKILSEQSTPSVDFDELKKQAKQLATQQGPDKNLKEGALTAGVIAHLVAGGILALPLVIKYIGEAIQYLGKGINFFTKPKAKEEVEQLNNKILNDTATTGDLIETMGVVLEESTAHWLHDKYVSFFTKVFGGTASFFYYYKTGKKLDSDTRKKIGKVFFYAAVIYLCLMALKAGITAFADHYGPNIITNSELVLGLIKVDELAAVAGLEDVILSVLAVMGGKSTKDVVAQQKKKIDDMHHSKAPSKLRKQASDVLGGQIVYPQTPDK